MLALLMAVAGGLATLLWELSVIEPAVVAMPAPPPPAATVGTEHCTPLEVDTWLRQRPAGMGDTEVVVCLAVAGRVGAARNVLHALEPHARERAVAALFATAHPIADAGDDKSAGPIMMLVVDYWPANYEAVFHAGMGELAAGHDASARRYLTNFLSMYTTADGWRAKAERAIAKLDPR